MTTPDKSLKDFRVKLQKIENSPLGSLQSKVRAFIKSIEPWRENLFPDIGDIPEGLPFSDPEEENPLNWPARSDIPEKIKEHGGYEAIGLIVYTGEAKRWEESFFRELSPSSWWRVELMKQGFEDLLAVWGKEHVISAARSIVAEIEGWILADDPERVSPDGTEEKSPPLPSDKAWICWANMLTGLNGKQTALKVYGDEKKGYRVSRDKQAVRKWLAFNGLPQSYRKPDTITVDPALLDMGERQDKGVLQRRKQTQDSEDD